MLDHHCHDLGTLTHLCKEKRIPTKQEDWTYEIFSEGRHHWPLVLTCWKETTQVDFFPSTISTFNSVRNCEVCHWNISLWYSIDSNTLQDSQPETWGRLRCVDKNTPDEAKDIIYVERYFMRLVSTFDFNLSTCFIELIKIRQSRRRCHTPPTSSCRDVDSCDILFLECTFISDLPFVFF